MRLRSFTDVALLVLALGGCVQSPDWIESTTLALDGGGGMGGGGTGGEGNPGMSGAAASGIGGGGMGGGGVGGMPNDAVSIDCSRRLRTAYFLFAPLADERDRDGDGESDMCTYGAYSAADAELRVLLAEIIYSMDPPQPNPEEVAPDRLCNAIDIRWHPWVGPTDFDLEKAAMCPRFCIALIDWINERNMIEPHCP